MKIIITSKGKSITDEMDPRFGRAAYLIIYETDSDKYDAIENVNAQISGGAGIQTAQIVASKGAKAVISGSFGPNAFNTLKAAGIKMYTSFQAKVIEVVNAFKEGKLKEIDRAV